MSVSINIPSTDKKRLVIVGAGFAGLKLAKRLAKSQFQVVLIDKNNFHQFQPLFYQVAMAGLEPSSISFPLRKMFQKNDNVVIRVTRILEVDPKAQIIKTGLGNLSYDYLVLAIGADTNFFGNENAANNAIPMKSVSEALYLRNEILSDYEKALTAPDYHARQGLIDIAIVGGGPTGVEVAGALAEMRKYILPKDYRELNHKEVDIYLIQGASELLKGMSKESSEEAERFLKDLGVKVIKNTRVTDVKGDYVFTNTGEQFQCKKVIWAAGICANTVKGLAEDCLTYGRRIKVNRFNQVDGYSNLFAVGDVCYMEEEAYPEGHPQVAQVAIQQGNLLSKNLKRLETGKEMKPFCYKDLGSMATIGRNRAVVDLPSFKTQGFFAWLIWLLVHLFSLIGVKNKIFVFINWIWNYFTYDQSLRLIIKPKMKAKQEAAE